MYLCNVIKNKTLVTSPAERAGYLKNNERLEKIKKPGEVHAGTRPGWSKKEKPSLCGQKQREGFSFKFQKFSQRKTILEKL